MKNAFDPKKRLISPPLFIFTLQREKIKIIYDLSIVILCFFRINKIFKVSEFTSIKSF